MRANLVRYTKDSWALSLELEMTLRDFICDKGLEEEPYMFLLLMIFLPPAMKKAADMH